MALSSIRELHNQSFAVGDYLFLPSKQYCQSSSKGLFDKSDLTISPPPEFVPAGVNFSGETCSTVPFFA